MLLLTLFFGGFCFLTNKENTLQVISVSCKAKQLLVCFTFLKEILVDQTKPLNKFH